jgi:hypothetical protein
MPALQHTCYRHNCLQGTKDALDSGPARLEAYQRLEGDQAEPPPSQPPSARTTPRLGKPHLQTIQMSRGVPLVPCPVGGSARAGQGARGKPTEHVPHVHLAPAVTGHWTLTHRPWAGLGVGPWEVGRDNPRSQIWMEEFSTQ